MENGYFGWVPLNIEMSDCIAAIFGANIIFVLRPTRKGCFKIVGEFNLYGSEKIGVSNCTVTDINLV